MYILALPYFNQLFTYVYHRFLCSRSMFKVLTPLFFKLHTKELPTSHVKVATSRRQGRRFFYPHSYIKLLVAHPRRTFYSLSDDLFHSESPDHYNRLSSLFDLSILQSSKHLLLRFSIDNSQFKLTLVRLRYSLGGDRPSQTTKYTMS